MSILSPHARTHRSPTPSSMQHVHERRRRRLRRIRLLNLDDSDERSLIDPSQSLARRPPHARPLLRRSSHDPHRISRILPRVLGRIALLPEHLAPKRAKHLLHLAARSLSLVSVLLRGVLPLARKKRAFSPVTDSISRRLDRVSRASSSRVDARVPSRSIRFDSIRPTDRPTDSTDRSTD